MHMHVSTSDMKRVMLAVTINKSGQMLPPMLILKGTTMDELPLKNLALTLIVVIMLPTKSMDGRGDDEQKIDLVCIPWQNTNALGIIPLLILDAYHVHRIENTVNWIQSLGIESIHTPVACTYLFQPIDVAINKSRKSGMREKWES